MRIDLVLRVLSLALTAAALLPSAASAALNPSGRTEVPVASSMPGDGVDASYVRLRVPLPATAAAHPEACDWIGYERFRAAGGPDDPEQADSVVVLMPGNLGGATTFDPLARNAIRAAAREGKRIEVWATDRRANCLEDTTGLQALAETGDRALEQAYYAGTAMIGGQRFAGWRQDPRVLADLGVAQTVQDFNAVLTRELPGQPWREHHVVCGGHSLGGGLLELFAGWDFDGDSATTEDAGYRQCAGFVGFDTLLDIGLTAAGERPKAGPLSPIVPLLREVGTTVAPALLRSGHLLRHEQILGIGPETMTAMQAAAILAATHPDEEATSWIRAGARSKPMNDFLHLAGSASLRELLFTHASLKDFRFTFAAFLDMLFDDNTTVLGFTRASLGRPAGAPLVRNRLPEQTRGLGLTALFQPGQLLIPRRTSPQALTTWSDAPGEITDPAQFARILFEGPTNFVESWFPSRIIADLDAVASGDHSGSLAPALHPHPTRRKPRLVVLGGEGYLKRTGIRSLDPHVVLPGYDHLDTITAAERQAGGRPEGSSAALVRLIDEATAPPATVAR